MQLTEAQSRELLAKHGAYVNEACCVDKWCPREERIIAALMAKETLSRIRAIHAMRRRRLDDLEGRILTPAEVQEARTRLEGKYATRKGGRPRKYRTDRERQAAKRQQQVTWQRGYRKRRSVEKNPLVSDSFHVSTEAENQLLATPIAGNVCDAKERCF